MKNFKYYNELDELEKLFYKPYNTQYQIYLQQYQSQLQQQYQSIQFNNLQPITTAYNNTQQQYTAYNNTQQHTYKNDLWVIE